MKTCIKGFPGLMGIRGTRNTAVKPLWECMTLCSSDSDDLWPLARTSHCATGQGSDDKRLSSDREIKHTQTCPPSVLWNIRPIHQHSTVVVYLCQCSLLFAVFIVKFPLYSNLAPDDCFNRRLREENNNTTATSSGRNCTGVKKVQIY